MTRTLIFAKLPDCGGLPDLARHLDIARQHEELLPRRRVLCPYLKTFEWDQYSRRCLTTAIDEPARAFVRFYFEVAIIASGDARDAFLRV